MVSPWAAECDPRRKALNLDISRQAPNHVPKAREAQKDGENDDRYADSR